ncbi:MAG TPA: NIL domain-containing protein [Clostridia bacterium]|nr:NIL domain-containing protein [Clostridia bacterium]
MKPQKIILDFNAGISDKPVIYHLCRDYDLAFNIIKANVNPQKEGMLILELSGERYLEGLDYLRKQGIKVQPLAEKIKRNETLCTNCGACTGVCPTGALYLERPSMGVHFCSDKCVVCQLCVKICPVKAMEVGF